MLVLDKSRSIVCDLLQTYHFAALSSRWRLLCRSFSNCGFGRLGGVLVGGLIVGDGLFAFDLDEGPIAQVPRVDDREADLVGRGVDGDPIEFEFKIVATFMLHLDFESNVAGVHWRFDLWFLL